MLFRSQTREQIFAGVGQPLIHQGWVGSLGHQRMPVSGDRKSERRQGACRIQALFQHPQLRQPGAERCLQLPVMKGQMVMKLRQMHARADRLKNPPNLFKPGKAALLTRGIPRRPRRRDPRFPFGVAMDKRSGFDRDPLRCSAKLLDRKSVV